MIRLYSGPRINETTLFRQVHSPGARTDLTLFWAHRPSRVPRTLTLSPALRARMLSPHLALGRQIPCGLSHLTSPEVLREDVTLFLGDSDSIGVLGLTTAPPLAAYTYTPSVGMTHHTT